MPIKRLILAAALLTPTAYGQGSYYGNIATIASKTAAVGQNAPLLSVPFAQVRVYTSAGLQAVLYSNAALSTTLPQPVIADASGRYGFYLSGGNYTAVIASSTGVAAASVPFSVGGSGGGGAVLPPSAPLLKSDSAGNAQAVTQVANALLNNSGVTRINGQDVPLGSTTVTLTAKLPANYPLVSSNSNGDVVAVILTTNGPCGPATLTAGVLNIPTCSGTSPTLMNVVLTDQTDSSHQVLSYANGHPLLSPTSSSTGAVTSVNFTDGGANYLLTLVSGRLQIAPTGSTTGAVANIPLLDSSSVNHPLSVSSGRAIVN